MKRVYTLYRVSTKGQVDKNDIPMQKTECRQFAERNGWQIVKEFFEKGVSGFKVSMDDRDVIQDLKEAAERKEFDILLVFMFDRLGRRENETPFIVEWFVKQGVEVWSTQEGQQRFESEADRLMNWIRYWQASGESRKTSMRVKTRLHQLTADGIYTGGPTPFGYELVRSGKFNKRNKELMDIVINEEEAPLVRMIFDMTVREGYGSHRLATFLNEKGIRTHNGAKFQCNTINRMLRNKIYCGYFVSGDVTSPMLENIRIIDEDIYDRAQYILDQRSEKEVEKQHIARTTKGHTMLSGNVYCAHCGCRLNSTSYQDRYDRVDGSTYHVRRERYICPNNVFKRSECDGQGSYVAHRVDEAVTEVLREYLERIKATPKSVALEKRYKKELDSLKASYKKTSDENEKQKRRLAELSTEIAKSLMGESRFTPEMLATAMDNLKVEIEKAEAKLAELRGTMNDQEGSMKKLDFYYSQFKNWADEFDTATIEQKKMIACQLITKINVGKGYLLDLEFNMDYNQFFMV